MGSWPDSQLHRAHLVMLIISKFGAQRFILQDIVPPRAKVHYLRQTPWVPQGLQHGRLAYWKSQEKCISSHWSRSDSEEFRLWPPEGQTVSYIRQRLPNLLNFILKWNAYPWCLLHQTCMLAGSLAVLLTGFNAPSCLQCLNLHISAALPLQTGSGNCMRPTMGHHCIQTVPSLCLALLPHAWAP